MGDSCLLIVPQEVVPGLFIGDLLDAERWPGPRLCVLEGPPLYPTRPEDRWFPVLDRDGKAHAQDLLQLHALIDEGLRANPRPGLLVHCANGAERAPLAVATWMASRGYAKNLGQAYKRLRAMRPFVVDRRAWLA